MKKIKLLTPILGLTALSSAFAPLTSCSCGDTYDVDFISTPDNTAWMEEITNKKGQDLVIRLGIATARECDWDASSITINGQLAQLGADWTFNQDNNILTIVKGSINGKVVITIVTKAKQSWEPYEVASKVYHLSEDSFTPDYLKTGVERMEKDVWYPMNEDKLWNAYRNSTDNLLKAIAQDTVWSNLCVMKESFNGHLDEIKIDLSAKAENFDWETKEFTGTVNYDFVQLPTTNDIPYKTCKIEFKNIAMHLDVYENEAIRLWPHMAYDYDEGDKYNKQIGDDWSIIVTYDDGDAGEKTCKIDQDTDISSQGEGKDNWEFIIGRILQEDHYIPYLPYYFKNPLLPY